MKYSRLAGVVVSTAALAAGLTTGAVAAENAPPSRTVSFQGYQVAVPAGWRVVDLKAQPNACVRFDQPAVYLGHPGAQQDCPSDLIGRTAGIVIEPLDQTAAVRPGAKTASAGAATAPAGIKSVDGDIQYAVEDAGVLVTASHSPDHEAVVRKALATAKLTKGGQPAKLSAPAPRTRTQQQAQAGIVSPGNMLGYAFDACTAPSQGAMNAWRSSPFKAVGIYISGSFRACAQPNITPSWISTNHANGWQFLPIDVGRQAPCSAFSSKMSYDQATARQQGRDAANNSANVATALGFGAGTALYSDIEGYPSNASCTAAVLSYVSGWTEVARTRGFLSGVYSSAASGIRDLANAYNNSAYLRPDHIWFAWWNGLANIDGGSYVSGDKWANHQRVHQYRGDHNETHGGVTINIDSNYLDVGTGGTPPDPGPTKFWVDTFADAPGYSTPGGTRTGTLYKGTNYVYCRVWGPKVQVGTSYNSWWLKTDLDVGPAGQYVSAYYLSRWGNDEAKDNSGNDIPAC